MEPSHQILEPRTARALLQRLRDANTRVSLFPGGTARLAGCRSLDAPIENGVHYRLCVEDRRPLELRLDLSGNRLLVECSPGTGAAPVTLRLSLASAGSGAVYVEELDARIHPDANDEEVIEGFMKKLGRYTLEDAMRDGRASA